LIFDEKKLFVKEKGKKESLLSRAASRIAKKQRNKRKGSAGSLSLCRNFWVFPKKWRPELDFRIDPVSLQTVLARSKMPNEPTDERSVATGDAMKDNRRSTKKHMQVGELNK
jgi:hypothetical protein